MERVTRLVGRGLTDDERALVITAIAEANVDTVDALIDFVSDRNRELASAISTGRYLDAILEATKRIGNEKAQRIMAREESSPYFLVDSTRKQLDTYSLADLTQTAEPDEDEIIGALRDLVRRRRATGCAIIMNSLIYLNDEVEPTTGERRRMEVLFGLAIARGGNRSILLPLDGGTPVWHDFTGVATGLERYTEIGKELAE